MKIVLYPDLILKQKAELIPIDSIRDYKVIVEEMHELLRSTGIGLGLAGNQVGIAKRVLVTNVEGPQTFINPAIIEVSSEEGVCSEGCLSFPDVGGFIVRPTIIKISFIDLDGQSHIEVFNETMARVLQHEIDHLDGLSLLDRMSKNEQRKNRKALKTLQLCKRLREG